MEKSLSYQDVYLSPNYSELKSRSEADISVEFLGRKFKAPWIPANMESVIDAKLAHWLSDNGYFYIYHRFGDTFDFVKAASREGSWKLISISIGVKQEDKDLLTKMFEDDDCEVDFITIDVAHGHSVLVKEMIEFIHNLYNAPYSCKNCPKIIAGNICTPEAVRDLASWGADAVKVGIAGGAACSTKNQTGFYIPMFSCVEDCETNGGPFCAKFNFCRSAAIPIVADGGIRENGDFAKAFVAGATMVMAGSIFAACVDAPGENIHKENPVFTAENFGNAPIKLSHYGKGGPITHKRYHGSASAKQKGEKKHVEGFEVEIPCNGMTYQEKYKELTESLQSAVSYSGGKDLTGFAKVKYITTK